MAYQTLYLRWRPSSFETLVGQAPVKQALMNALTSGRIAHAYLFTGPRGTGKTTTARIFAKALNCVKGPTDHPCGECLNCRQITDGSAMDVQELDAASNRGVDDIKNLNKNADFAPVNCRYKVYIIDEAHMLTTEACNALLKTLEEPPEHVVFILATTEPQKILPTIHSRCQRFDFHPITQEEIVAHLQKVAEGSDIKADKEALELIAAASEGGMRDALSLLEQCGVMAESVTTETVRSVRGIIGREILRELVNAVGRREVTDALLIFDRLLMQGKDISQILIELSGYLRALLLYKAAPEYQSIYVTDTAEELGKISPLYSGERILAAQEIIHQAMNELRFTARGRITAEMCLYDLCREDNRTLKVLAARINQLERELAAIREQGIVVSGEAKPADSAVKVAAPEPLPERINQEPPKPEQRKAEPPKPEPAKPEKVKTEKQKTAQSGALPVKPEQPIADAIPTTPVRTTIPVEKEKENVAQTVAHAVSSKPKLPEAASQTETVPAAGGYTPYKGDWAQGDEYWSRTMEILKAEGKNSIASCASHGSVVAYENQTLILGFKMKFLGERLQKADYREVVEAILLRVARIPIRLQCVVDTGGKPAGSVPAKGGRSGTTSKTTAAQSAGSVKVKSDSSGGNTASVNAAPTEKELVSQQSQVSGDKPEPNVSASTKKAMEMFNATLHKV
ncbi:MAG: DNA polymerase III subunit gamma/tau [Acidaminococcaceae bacterium]|nr:DNA polymerase III subunit gamma/tau [Acidaminococcaceae bacterium]